MYTAIVRAHFKCFNIALQVLPLPVIFLLHIALCRGAACWRVTCAVTTLSVTAAVLCCLHVAPVQLHDSALELAPIVQHLRTTVFNGRSNGRGNGQKPSVIS
jgi:hypothetical protein